MEDESIPEESECQDQITKMILFGGTKTSFISLCVCLFLLTLVRDGIRTFVGQARLLMKERFKQFSGLVDNCEFSRGEKITTCSDLQGFWDMVYYQVTASSGNYDIKHIKQKADNFTFDHLSGGGCQQKV